MQARRALNPFRSWVVKLLVVARHVESVDGGPVWQIAQQRAHSHHCTPSNILAGLLQTCQQYSRQKVTESGSDGRGLQRPGSRRAAWHISTFHKEPPGRGGSPHLRRVSGLVYERDLDVRCSTYDMEVGDHMTLHPPVSSLLIQLQELTVQLSPGSASPIKGPAEGMSSPAEVAVGHGSLCHDGPHPKAGSIQVCPGLAS